MATITFTASSIESDDGIIPSTSGFFDRACIGLKMKFAMSFELSGFLADGVTPFTIGGCDVHLNIGAFLNIGQRFQPRGSFPTDGYFCIPPDNTPFQTYPMTIQGNSLGYQSQDSGNVELQVVSGTEFGIEWTFYMTADILSYINGSLVDYNARLAGTRPFNAPLFENNLSSVYNQTKWLSSILAIVAPDGTTAISEQAQEVRGNFYNEHVDGFFGSSVFNVVQALPLSANLPFELSQYEDVRYRVIIQNPNGITPARVRVICWTDADQWNGTWDNTVGLIDGVVTAAPGGTSVIAGIFKEPSDIVATSTLLTIYTTIDHTLLDPSKTYYIAYLVGYDNGTGEAYQAFIKPEGLQVTAPPTPVALNVEGFVRNLNNEASEIAFGIAPSERIEQEVRLDRVAYNTDIAAAGYGFGFGNDFRAFTFTVKNAATQEILFTTSRERLPGGAWPTDNVFSYQYNVSDYDIITWLHRIPGYTEGANTPDWSGLTIITEWVFSFIYGQEFTVNYTYSPFQFIQPYENEQANPALLVIESTVVLNGSDGLPAVEICNEDFVIVESRLIPALIPLGDQFSHVALVDRFIFGNKFTFNGQVKEREDYTPIEPLPQLQQAPVIWCDPDFTGGVARYAVDVTQLDEDVQYLFSAIAIKIP